MRISDWSSDVCSSDLSPVGFALGLLRGGPLGALAAWASFTLPAAIALVLCARGAAAFEGPLGSGFLHGLKVVAVAVVAQAVWGMARALCPDRTRAGIALLAVLIVIFMAGPVGQVAAIVAGGLAGLRLCRSAAPATVGHLTVPVPRRAGATLLALCLPLPVLLPLPRAGLPLSGGVARFDALSRSRALGVG